MSKTPSPAEPKKAGDAAPLAETATPSDSDGTDEQIPAEGGSYVRNPDGSLTRKAHTKPENAPKKDA